MSAASAIRMGAVSHRFAAALQRLDERMERQAMEPGADAPAFVQLYARYDSWASVVETKAANHRDPVAAGRALRQLHKLQCLHATLVGRRQP